MTMILAKDAKTDLIARGYSRRQPGRLGALLGAGAAANAMLADLAQCLTRDSRFD